MLRSFRDRSALVISVSLFALAAAAPASAQTADQGGQAGVNAEEGSAEDVVVTGSRIARPEFEAPNPIQAFTAETIEQSGKTNVTQFLVDSPALLASLTTSDTAGSAANYGPLTVGGSYLNLRGLGTARTLVLVDGRRHVAGRPGSAAVDINTIPVDLIERVDVLTGGASAVYGADGVSGVVNFVTKRDFEGFRLRGQAGISQRGDSGNRYIGAVVGKNFADGRANLTATYEYSQEDRFSQLQRLNYGRTGPTFRFVRNPADAVGDNPNLPDNLPLRDLRWADTSPGGAFDLDQDFVPDFTGEGKVYDVGTYVARSSFTIGGDSTLQEIYFGDTTPQNERHIATLSGSFEISPALRLFADGKYVRNDASTFQQPTYDLYVTIYGDNAYLNQRYGAAVQGDALLLGRDHFDFGVREFKSKRETIRSVIGADGDLGGGLAYELSYVFGQTKFEGEGMSRVRDRYYAAIDAVTNPANGQVTCRINLPGQTRIQNFGYIATQQYGTFNPVTGNYEGPAASFRPGECVPLSLMGNGAPTQAALDFVFSNDFQTSRIRQHVVSGSIRGNSASFFNLPGGPVGFAVGGEYRKESYEYNPSALSEQGLLLDSSQASPDFGSFDVKEVFGEIDLPIIRDGFVKTLSVGGAVRFSDYSTIGKTTTWSVNGVFAPIEDISFRGTLGQSVRAPNIGELFSAASGTYEFIPDPCGIDRINDGTSTRAANCAAQLAAVGININDIDPATDGAQPFDPAGDPISPTATSLLGRAAGNRTLQEESARTWTAGVVLRPRFIPNLQIAVDWYDIRINQAINTPTAQELAELCVDQPTLNNVYCANLQRDPTTGYFSDYLVTPANVANFKTAGLDVVVNYRVPTNSLGTFNLKVTGNYLNKLEFIATPGAEVDNNLEESAARAPKYSATADIAWSLDGFTLNYGVNYFSKTLRYTREQSEAQPDITSPEFFYFKPRWEHELQLSYNVDDRFTFYAGANNLFDAKPDVGSSFYPVSSVGRYLYAGFKAKVF